MLEGRLGLCHPGMELVGSCWGEKRMGKTYTCADTAIAFQHSLLSICEWPFRLHSHSHSATMTATIIRLRVLDLSRGFSTNELRRYILRINRLAVIIIDLEIKDIESKILECVCLSSLISPKSPQPNSTSPNRLRGLH